jgi:hypothetical protein
MFIEIREDIVEDAIDKKEMSTNDSLDLLIKFSYCAQAGKHVVTVPCLNNSELIKQLCSVMPKRNVEMLLASKKIRYQLKAIKSHVSIYAIITYQEIVPTEGVIVVNPQKRKYFEPYSESRVLTEHINDSMFFRYLVRFYLKDSGIGKWRFYFEPAMGAGSTTADVLSNIIKEEKYFCLTIADGDKKYPTSDYGETANKIKDIMEAEMPFNCDYYIMDNVTEIENLIPIKILNKIVPRRGYRRILGLDFSFYDMKKGLTLDGIYDDNICNYWRNILVAVGISFSQRDNAKNNSTGSETYKAYIRQHKYQEILCLGFGSDLLDMCVESPKTRSKTAHLDMDYEFSKINREDLTDAQYKEWISIGKKMFSWTCGMKPRRA